MATIKIKRDGYTWWIRRELTEEEKKNVWHKRKTIEEELSIVEAKVISRNLALFQYQSSDSYNAARYHVIHIPTGLVIADITYDMVSLVKKTFEQESWTLRGSNTFVLCDDKIYFEMTCKIRYDIVEE